MTLTLLKKKFNKLFILLTGIRMTVFICDPIPTLTRGVRRFRRILVLSTWLKISGASVLVWNHEGFPPASKTRAHSFLLKADHEQSALAKHGHRAAALCHGSARTHDHDTSGMRLWWSPISAFLSSVLWSRLREKWWQTVSSRNAPGG